MSAQDTLQPSPSVRDAETEDGSVLLDVEQGVCFSLNPLGAQVWQLVKRNFSLDQIVHALEKQFRVPRDELTNDVQEFVHQLESRGLLLARDRGSTEHQGNVARVWRKYFRNCS